MKSFSVWSARIRYTLRCRSNRTRFLMHSQLRGIRRLNKQTDPNGNEYTDKQRFFSLYNIHTHKSPMCMLPRSMEYTHVHTLQTHDTHAHTLLYIYHPVYRIQCAALNRRAKQQKKNTNKNRPTMSSYEKKHNNNTALCQRSPKWRADRLKPTHVRRWVAVKQQKRDSRNANEQSKKAHIAQSGYYLML